MEKQGSSSGESAEQEGGKAHTEGATPEERVQGMHASVRRLVDQGGAAESLPCQQPQDSPSFIAFYKKSGENACFQLLAFRDSIAYLSFAVSVRDGNYASALGRWSGPLPWNL